MPIAYTRIFISAAGIHIDIHAGVHTEGDRHQQGVLPLRLEHLRPHRGGGEPGGALPAEHQRTIGAPCPPIGEWGGFG